MDGRVIPDDQHTLYAAGRYNDVPVLAGYNSDEGASFGNVTSRDAYIDPNAAGLPAWPAYHDAAPQMMYLVGSPKAGPLVSGEGLKILDEYFAWRRR